MRSLRRLCLLVSLLGGVVLGGCGGGDQAGREPEPRPPARLEGLAAVPAITRALEPSVVAILAEGPQGAGEGSGVVYAPDTIVTNNHVVEGAREVTVVLAGGQRLRARVRATDPQTDLGVLTVERDDLPPARFVERLPAVGSLAVAIGNPLGFEGSVTAGVVSGVDRAIPSGGQEPALVGLIQTDAAISPGNSGGALVGPGGRVIGINVAYIPPQARAVALGFAIPAPTVTGIVEQLLDDGDADNAFLGVRLRQLTAPIARQIGLESDAGALIEGVTADGPAGRAGLRPGDVITRIDGRDVEIVEDVIAALRRRAPGDRIAVEYLRDGQRRRTSVTLAGR